MKKKILALLLTVALCLSLAIPCFADNKLPAIEIMELTYKVNSAGGVSPTIRYCNNSGKVIKYISWYMTPYNAVNDPVFCTVRGKSEVVGKTTGPIEPFSSVSTKGYIDTYTSISRPQNDLFYKFYLTTYEIYNNGKYVSVSADKYGNYFVDPINPSTGNYDEIYLSANEISNFVSDSQLATFDCAWYNSTIRSFNVTKAIVEYMDGSTQTIPENQLYSTRTSHVLENKPFKEMLNLYSPVYNYKEYLQYNPDLTGMFGDDQWKLFEHFINSGMKEGRQGCSSFNLTAYKVNNPDLVAQFGDENAKYYEHYMAGGKAEGRKAV